MISTTNSIARCLFASLKKFHKPSKQLIGLAFLLAAIPQISYAATTYIGDGVTTAVSSLSNGDSVSFNGTTGSPSEGTLNVYTNRTLDSVSANYLRGEINFTTASALTVNSLGSLSSINFDVDGTLAINADLRSIVTYF